MSIFKYLIWFVVMTFSINPAFAWNIESVFTDIKNDYKYYDELQYLYDKWVFIPDTNNKFNPQSTLQRDEFVWSVLEISCDKCIHPNSSINYVLKYQDSKDVFYDITKSNPYFYCIAWAKEKKTVQWYWASYTCSNWTTKAWSVPFCPENSIQRQEAIAVLLRNANILTLEQANAIKYNSFEPYLQKALETQLTITKTNWTQVTYKLLEKDANWNTYPEQYITKEEFLKMSFIIAKIWPCSVSTNSESSIAWDLNIYDKSCDKTKTNCEPSAIKDPSGTYDFKAEINTTCAKWVKQYKWIFYNASKQIIKELTWEYVDNYTLWESGLWNVRMIAEDNCGGVTESYSTIYVWDKTNNISTDIVADPIYWAWPLTVNFSNITSGCNEWCTYLWDFKDGNTSTLSNPINTFTKAWTYEVMLTVQDKYWNKATSLVSIKVSSDSSIWSQIIVYDKNCDSTKTNCTKSDLTDQKWTYDYYADVETTCLAWIKSYNWQFFHVVSNTTKNYYTQYLDNISLELNWTRTVTLNVFDNCSRKTTSMSTIENNIVWDTKPSVEIIANPIYWTWPLTVDFDSIVSNCKNNCSYLWDFKDWTTSTESNPKHTFPNPWAYIVDVVITDENWDKAVAKVTINVISDKCVWENCNKDTDRDWIIDSQDSCIYVEWVIENNWCPILDAKCSIDTDCKQWYSCDLKSKTCTAKVDADLIWTCIYPINWSSVFGNSTCNTCPCEYDLNFQATLRKCDIVLPAIVSPDWKQIYSAWKAYQIPYKK